MPRLGPTAGWYLRLFGAHVDRAFGHVPYHVGSSLTADTFRDVDVRLILPDNEMESLFGKPTDADKLRIWNLAWSALGAQMTGLPIDFQFQKETPANELEDGPRSALHVLSSELSIVMLAEDSIEEHDGSCKSSSATTHNRMRN